MQTFYDDGRGARDFADPYCPTGRATAIDAAAERTASTSIDGGTMVVVEGPRFSTRAESRWYAAHRRHGRQHDRAPGGRARPRAGPLLHRDRAGHRPRRGRRGRPRRDPGGGLPGLRREHRRGCAACCSTSLAALPDATRDCPCRARARRHRLPIAAEPPEQAQAAGRCTTNRQPPSTLSTATSPWCASTRPRTIARPSPPPAPRRRRTGAGCGPPRRGTPRRRPAAGPPRGCRRSVSVTASQPPRASRPPVTVTVPSRRRVPDRVAQQVGDDPGQLRLARRAPSASPSRRRTSRTPRPAATGAADGDRVGDDVAERHRAERQPQRAGVDPGQLEQVVDERAPSGRSRPGSAGGTRRPSRVVDHAVLQRLGHRAQPGQRRAQVVRHPGDQLAAAGLHLPFPLARLGRPHRVGGEPPPEPDATREADRAGHADHDQQHAAGRARTRNIARGDRRARRRARPAR